MWEGIEPLVQKYIDKSVAEDLSHIEDVYLSTTTPRKGNFWVVRREGGSSEVLGMVGLQCLNEDECELRRMSVSPNARRMRIGSSLVNKLLSFAKEQGYKKCVLSTLERMTAGRRLYESHGFKEIKKE